MILRTLTSLALACAALQAQAPKNVIFFLGDGMGPAAVTAARIYRVGEAGTLTMDTLPRTARIRTYSGDAQTTDSAPSMAAYMTGVKMNNEVISMSPETKAIAPGVDLVNNCGSGNGVPVATLLELAKAKGKAIGAVTTTRVTHATPAATFAHICHRDAENDIAAQAVPGGAGYNAALLGGLDVLLGGGRRHFLPKAAGGKRIDGRDLTAEFATAGYPVVQTATALRALPADTSKLVGLFHMDHMDFELDRMKKGLDQPSLAEMTTKALDVLSKNANGYFLMVEGGRIDHALHNTNAKRALEDTVAFDDALAAVLAKVDLANTLVVVTADHDHTLAINGYAKLGNPILDIVRDYKTNQPLLDADGHPYTALVFGNGPNRKDVRTDLVSGSADSTQVLHDDYLQESSVRMAAGSETHGGGDVKLFATGAGATTFKGTMENTTVFMLVKTAAGL